jgi:hypothetical protein
MELFQTFYQLMLVLTSHAIHALLVNILTLQHLSPMFPPIFLLIQIQTTSAKFVLQGGGLHRGQNFVQIAQLEHTCRIRPPPMSNTRVMISVLCVV